MFRTSPAPGAASHRGLLASLSDGRLDVRHASWIVTEDGHTIGAVFGTVTAGEAARLVERLLRHDDPGPTAQDLPWAAVALRSDGTAVATSSMMLTSGLFFRDAAPTGAPRAGAPPAAAPPAAASPAGAPRTGAPSWVVGTDPHQVARLDGATVALDLDFLAGFLLLESPPDSGPFRGVRRSPGGQTLRWDGRVRSTQWCGPDTVAEPTRAGADLITDYLDAFDEVTAGLAGRSGPVVTTLSGGLDSTFMVASLARVTPGDEPIQAYCHSPLPQAHAPAVGEWDPDDLPMAQVMARACGDRVRLTPLRNEARIHPLDAAARVAWTRGWPVSAVGNIGWLTQFADRAVTAGATLRFFGTHGNAAFSASHLYAAEHYLRRGRPWRALWLCAPSMRGDQPVRSAARTRVVEPLRRRQPNPSAAGERHQRVGIMGPNVPAAAETGSGRDQYLRWLTGRLWSLTAANNPTSVPGNLVADPYASRTMIELAASIEPGEWQRGHLDRALARRLGQGRVPDEIRLRRRRGGQGRDTLFIVRHEPGRLLDSLATTPAQVWHSLGIDAATLRRSAETILDPETEPSFGWVQDVLRAAAMGEFVRDCPDR